MVVEPSYPTRVRKPVKKWVKVVFWLIFTPLFLLILTEAALRRFAPVGPHPAVSYTLKQKGYGIDSEFVYSQNSLGLRTHALEVPGTPGKTIKILVTGGDMASCPLQGSDAAWWGLLQDGLNAELADTGWLVQVSCLPAFHSDVFGVYYQLRDRWDYVVPDFVILCVGLEDHLMADLANANYKPAERLSWAEQELPVWGGRVPITSKKLGEFSQIYQRMKNSRIAGRLDAFYQPPDGVSPYWQKIEMHRKSYWGIPVDSQAYQRTNRTALFQAGVKRVYEWLSEKKVNFVAVGQPTIMAERMTEESISRIWMPMVMSGSIAQRVKNNGPVVYRSQPGDFRDQLQKFNTIHRDTVLKSGGWYIPLEQMQRDPAYFEDECNFTDEGQKAAASFIQKQILPLMKEFVNQASKS